jgi:hypothetical protein
MWGFTGGPGQVSPFLAATRVFRGDVLLPLRAANGTALPQPEGAPAVPLARLPSGFWNGRVSLEAAVAVARGLRRFQLPLH